MDGKRYIQVGLIVMINLSIALGFAQKKTPSKAKVIPNTGKLKIECPVEGATFVIDEGMPSEQKGQLPLMQSIELKPGPHTIRVSKEGYLPFSDVFDVEAGQETVVQADLVHYSGILKVESIPVGARIEVDGQEIGISPVTKSLPIGEHVVKATKENYREVVEKVVISTGQETKITLKMLAEEEALKIEGREPITKKWWFWTAVGGSTLAVAITAITIPLVLGKSKTKEVAPDTVFVIPGNQ